MELNLEDGENMEDFQFFNFPLAGHGYLVSVNFSSIVFGTRLSLFCKIEQIIHKQIA